MIRGVGRALRAASALALLSLAACMATGDRAACERAGGEWGSYGLLGTHMCNRPTADAGRPCAGPDECQSVCIAAGDVPVDSLVTGQCYGYTVTLGTCLNRVRRGRVEGVICED